MTQAAVPWLPWSADAFERARREDRPVLLSLSVRWDQACREMDETTYADPLVAQLLREQFVAIRADADLRPDVYDRYDMGPLPVTVFLTPEGRIIAGASYFAPEDMRRALSHVADLFRDHRKRLYEQIREREERTRQFLADNYAPLESITPSILQNTLRGIAGAFDATRGGFGAGPRFPYADSLRLLLDAFLETGGRDFALMCRKTLDAIAHAGLFDPVEGGFFRYTTDPAWTRPRTEKLLEDNARLAEVLLSAATVWGEMEYQNRAERTIRFLLEVLYDPSRGLFRGSRAADDEYYALDAERARRTPPPVDDVAFVDANAVTARFLLGAAAALDRADLADAALKALSFLWERGFDPARGIPHYFEGDRPAHFLQPRDAVELLDSLVVAYEYTGDLDWIRRAAQLEEVAWRRFHSELHSGLLDRAPSEDAVGELAVPRRAERETALLAHALLRLSEIEARPDWRDRAAALLLGFPDYKADHGHATTALARAADLWVRGPEVLALVGDRADPRYPVWRDIVMSTPRPRRLILHVDPERQPERRGRLPEIPKDLPAVFVGRAGRWEGPFVRPDALVEHLNPPDEEAP